jgi:hypothetical protein
MIPAGGREPDGGFLAGAAGVVFRGRPDDEGGSATRPDSAGCQPERSLLTKLPHKRPPLYWNATLFLSSPTA